MRRALCLRGVLHQAKGFYVARMTSLRYTLKRTTNGGVDARAFCGDSFKKCFEDDLTAYLARAMKAVLAARDTRCEQALNFALSISGFSTP